jgi:hypothetical protein
MKALLDVLVDTNSDVCEEAAVIALRPQILDVMSVQSFQRLCTSGGIVLVGPTVVGGTPSIRAIRELREHVPQAVIIVCSRKPEDHRLLTHFARVGADAFVTIAGKRDVDDLAKLVEVRRLAPPPVEELKLLHSERRASWARAAVEHCVRNAYCPRKVVELAHWFGIAGRTLRDRLEKARYPAPHLCLPCGRFLHGAELIAHGVGSPREVAFRLGFSDSTDMRKKKWQLRVSARGNELVNSLVHSLPRLNNLLNGDS